MIKKILLAVLVALPMCASAQKFGIVDLDAVFMAMPETEKMQTELKNASDQLQSELEKAQNEVQNLYVEYQKVANDPSILDSIKERRRQEIDEKYEIVERLRNKSQQDLMQMQQNLMAPIQAKITDAIKAVGAEGGYTFIFPNEPSLILYQGSDVADITAAVKEKLGLAK